MKNITQLPLKWNGLVQLIRVGNSIRLWVNVYTDVYFVENVSKAEKKKEKQKISGPLLEACDDVRSQLALCNIGIMVNPFSLAF